MSESTFSHVAACLCLKKGKRKVQRVPHLQAAALPKRKRKQTKPNKRKLNKRAKSVKISSLFPKRGNRNAKRTEKHKNKITQGKTCLGTSILKVKVLFG